MSFALGFATAFLVLAVLFALRVRRWRRWRRAAYGMSRGDARAAAGGRWMFRGLFSRLDTSPSQEKVLVEEAAAVREAFLGLRADWAAARGELADLLASVDLDAARVDAVLASREARLAEVRRRAAEALARFHAVLDEGQRKALAAMVREGHVLAPARAHGHGRRC
jgi:uncharacterized membrane protein